MAGQESDSNEATSNHVAVIFGVTGLVGKELARRLSLRTNWKVYGIARNPEIVPIKDPNFHFISCDLLNPLETQEKLSSLQDVSHLFWITWANQFPLDTQECWEQNRGMMSNALNAILPTARALKHVSLQTGMKHYISLQDPSYLNDHYHYEECPRISTIQNFYYALEDLLTERLAGKVAWSVHRPGVVMGSSNRSLYNLMGALCVYGAICKRQNLPFVFGGTRQCWEETYIDGSDARLVADQHIWAATDAATYSTDGQAFNAINGPPFTWKEIWPAIGMKLGVEVPEDMFSEEFRFSTAMADKKGVWEEIVTKEGLLQTGMEDLANWEFLDLLLRCPFKLLGTRQKADRLGFTARYETLTSILHWIDFMRAEKLIP
ncbi:3-oxo-Delta(4,5)-steroid 5-beta-reductase [Morella rubra]|uniref:3-oxo-Delta(4,5)-steroid 5-beta-reductase n=1 Tax=Morella rubra TaxID=262757 RepID=A0A6A1WM22_9ROSI|nr:3-oxo-Delta(4,5)-steroid 5-beta-reductase [Morella rubra]